MASDREPVEFEDGESTFHPVYAFKKLSKTLITQTSILIATGITALHIFIGVPMKVVFWQVVIMAIIKSFQDNTEPDDTEVLKIQQKSNDKMSKRFGADTSKLTRMNALQRGDMPCETVTDRKSVV